MSKIVALPWYHRSDWPRLHDAFADRDAISPDYDAWKRRAISREAKWRDDGYAVRRIAVEPEAFLTWCRETGRACDHASRRAYAEEKIAEQRLPAFLARPADDRILEKLG